MKCSAPACCADVLSCTGGRAPVAGLPDHVLREHVAPRAGMWPSPASSFGRGNPPKVFLAALLFGFIEALGLRMQKVHAQRPDRHGPLSGHGHYDGGCGAVGAKKEKQSGQSRRIRKKPSLRSGKGRGGGKVVFRVHSISAEFGNGNLAGSPFPRSGHSVLVENEQAILVQLVPGSVIVGEDKLVLVKGSLPARGERRAPPHRPASVPAAGCSTAGSAPALPRPRQRNDRRLAPENGPLSCGQDTAFDLLGGILNFQNQPVRFVLPNRVVTRTGRVFQPAPKNRTARRTAAIENVG